MLTFRIVITYFLALFSFNTIPLESDPIKGVIVSIDDLYNDTFVMWDKIFSIADDLNITSYVYITQYTNKTTILANYCRKYKNIIIITDYTTNTIWMRDYGPIFYKNKYGDLNILKIHYKHHRKYDKLLPFDFSYRFDIPITKIDTIMEGGNFITNGDGICIVSDKVLEYNLDINILK